MARYHNKEFTKKVGAKVKKEREHAKLEIEDISEMTGFHRNVIISIENGTNTDISHIAEIALALKIHPKELLNVDVVIKPRFKLSAVRHEKSRITTRILELCGGGFFNTWRASKEVQIELAERFPNLKISTKNISVILSRLNNNGKLEVSKRSNSRYNYYKKTKKS
ncbi:helix-turn-helix domain-containing protein [Niabella hirudinis]|uniref:helix-turn-helix domain-containing protein n=1 Tax=Niabella hirudinis TaxID=1285929 RepID=UPI003EBAFC74